MCSCGHANRAHRATCHRCQKPVAASVAVQAKAERRSPSVGARAPSAPSLQTPKAAGTRPKSTSPFDQAVLKEATQYQASDSNAATSPAPAPASSEPAGEREQLHDAALEAAQALFAQKRTQLETLRTKLRAAEEARDKACRKHSVLNEELINLKVIIEFKASVLAAAAEEVKKAAHAVTTIQDKMTAADMLQVGIAASTSALPPAMTSIQRAAGLAVSLGVSSEAWMASLPSDGAPPHHHDGSSEEPMEDEREREAFTNDPALARSSSRPTAASSGPAPFRSSKVRSDPYLLKAVDRGRREHCRWPLTSFTVRPRRPVLSGVVPQRTHRPGGSCRVLAGRPVNSHLGNQDGYQDLGDHGQTDHAFVDGQPGRGHAGDPATTRMRTRHQDFTDHGQTDFGVMQEPSLAGRPVNNYYDFAL